MALIYVMEHGDTSNICDGARRYMEHWMFRWKSWVEELIHKQLHQFSSKILKAQYMLGGILKNT
jgi:hypothetical protein